MKKSVYYLSIFWVFICMLSLVFAEVEESIDVEFSNQGDCYSTPTTSAWRNLARQITNWTVDSNGELYDCFPSDGGSYFYNSSCCPSGFSCLTTIGSEQELGGRCIYFEGFCSTSGSITSGACVNLPKEVAERELQVNNSQVFLTINGEDCINSTSVSCTWIIDDGDVGSCMASEVRSIYCNESGIVNQSKCVYQFLSQDSHCDDARQVILVNYTAFAKNITSDKLVSPELLGMEGWCKNSTKEYACSASIQLPSFSMFNFILSFLGILGVYFLFKKNFKESI